MSVIIVGGGIVGVSCAVELARRGEKVILLERGKIGHGCSYGNAGWMTPCFAMPLPQPGLFWKSLTWLTNPESPLYIKPEPSLTLFRWLYYFMRAMNEKQMLRGMEALVTLSKESLIAYQNLAQRFPGDFGFQQKGLLMVAQTKSGMKAAELDRDRMSTVGILGKKLSSEEVRLMEPSVTGGIEGAVYFPNEAHGEPLRIVQSLAKEALNLGVIIYEDTEVFRFDDDNGKISKLMTSRGEMMSDRYVLATGSWSTELAKNLRLSVPILGGKGYALITPPIDPQPKYPMMLLEKKIAVTPRDGSLRIAGTLELVNQDFSVNQRRVNAILKGARQFLPVPENPKVLELWRGLRPCTPDGLPMMGFSKHYSNLALACGHQMLGLQAGYGSGIFIADLFEGKTPSTDVSLYNPNRF